MDDAGKAALLVCGALLGACSGSAFTSSDSGGGTGTAAGKVGTEGGTAAAGTHAGGVASAGAAAGGASSRGGSPTGGVVTNAAGGPTELVGGAGGAPDTAGGGPPCLRGWQGSACDTCTTSPSVPGSETCAELLACYQEKGPGNCDYAVPTADAVVKIAHEVWECRGACQ